jgi:hypothetical protein
MAVRKDRKDLPSDWINDETSPTPIATATVTPPMTIDADLISALSSRSSTRRIASPKRQLERDNRSKDNRLTVRNR